MYKLYTRKPGIAASYIHKTWLIMRYTAVILIATLMQVSAATLAQRITVNQKNAPLENVLRSIRTQSGYDIIFDQNVVGSIKSVNVSVTNVSLEEAMDSALSGQSLSYSIKGKIVAIKSRAKSILEKAAVALPAATVQYMTVSGVVTDAEDGKPLPGVSVRVKGTKTAAQTTADGRYSISVPDGSTILEFSYIGYVRQERPVSAIVNVSLVANSETLSDVVVVGYQTIPRKDNVGALSEVAGKTIANKPIVNFTQLLQGTATGLQVTAGSGRPGQTAFIRIRGTGSINASSEPLIVLDGIQISTAAYAAINPNDIASVTVLKDAQSTAIYGSRGSNGVILVTTKTGTPGQPSVNYSFRFGKTKAQNLKNLKLMNSAEKLQYEYDLGFTNATLDSMITNRNFPAGSDITTLSATDRQNLWDLASSRGAGDWRKYLLQTATMKTHELSLSGGADRLTYYLSGLYSDNPGVERYSAFNKKGGRLNVTYQVKDWFKMGTNIGVNTTHEMQVREAYNTQNSYAATFFFNPYEQPYNTDGSFNTTLSNGFSPIEGAVNNPVTYDRINQFGSFYGEARFFKHLTLKSLYAVNYNTFKYQSYLQPGSNLAGILGYNQKNDQANSDFFYSITNTANWNQTVGKHSFNALLGNEYDKSNVYNLSATGRGFPSKSYTTLDNAATPTTASSSITQFSLISYFASLAYNYDKRFFVTLSGRRDGSSRFGTNVKFANFGAIGLAWDLKNERWFTLPNYVSELKLRGSYGTSGNNTIPEYQALGTYSLTTKYNDQTAAVPLRLANPDLTWETSHNKDIGLTYGFLDSRITGEIDYYNRRNSNLLYNVNVSATTGFTSYTGNVGGVRNKGIEFAVSGAIVRNKDVKWNVNFMYSHNDNKVTDLYSDKVLTSNSEGLAMLAVGQPLNNFYLVKFKGVDPADGKNVYYNIDGTETKTYSGSQAQLLNGKSPNVKYFGSFGSNVSYKGFDLSAMFYYSGGNYVYNNIWADGVSNGSAIYANQFTEATDYWKKPGDVTRYPNPLDPTQQTVNTSDQFLQKGDYLSLRDVTLGYTVDNKWTKHIGVASVRVFAQGTNLALWTKYKGLPEVGQTNSETTGDFPGTTQFYGYPPIKGYTFGIDVRF